MERDIIYHHIAIQKFEQHILNKQSIFINYIYIYQSINLNAHVVLKKQTNLKC